MLEFLNGIRFRVASEASEVIALLLRKVTTLCLGKQFHFNSCWHVSIRLLTGTHLKW